MVDRGPGGAIAPAIEIPLYRAVGREILRQHPPLAARSSKVEYRIHDRAQPRGTRAPAPRRRWQMRGDHRPFRIRGIACVALSVPPILRAGNFSPTMAVSPS